MTRTYPEIELTESMLSSEYSENGIVVKTHEDALALLKKRGFVMLNGEYRGKGAKTARIYKLRNAILDGNENVVGYKSMGVLVSFGGREPKSCYDLKFSKIKRPMS